MSKAEINRLNGVAESHQRLAAIALGRLDRKRTELAKLPYADWKECLLRSILEEFHRRTGLDFLRPLSVKLPSFGIRSECPVFARDADGNAVATLVFTPGNLSDAEILLDTGEKTDRFTDGTVGALNRCNNVTEEVVSVDTAIDNCGYGDAPELIK